MISCAQTVVTILMMTFAMEVVVSNVPYTLMKDSVSKIWQKNHTNGIAFGLFVFLS